jgi:hypothetical protein
MKRQVLLAALAFAFAASTQAATYNGDLVIGFTSASGNDFELDLGAASSLSSGQTFNLGSQLSGFNLSTVNWGVVGTATVSGARTSWVTVNTGLTPNQINGLNAWSKVNTAVSAVYTLFGTAGAGNSATPNSGDDNSWNQQTRLGSIATQYHNVYEDPNSIGTTSADFYSVINNNTPGSLLGTFSLNSSGILTFTAVPEPSTYGVLAGMGLLLLTLRRRLVSKNV